MRHTILEQMLFPVLLGDGIGLLKSAHYFYHTFGVKSHAFTRKYHFLLPILYSAKVYRLQKTEYPFLCEKLMELSESLEDQIPCLIPCDAYAEQFLSQHRELLEPYYIFGFQNSFVMSGNQGI